MKVYLVQQTDQESFDGNYTIEVFATEALADAFAARMLAEYCEDNDIDPDGDLDDAMRDWTVEKWEVKTEMPPVDQERLDRIAEDKEREELKKAALAKLTDEERQALGVGDDE